MEATVLAESTGFSMLRWYLHTLTFFHNFSRFSFYINVNAMLTFMLESMVQVMRVSWVVTVVTVEAHGVWMLNQDALATPVRAELLWGHAEPSPWLSVGMRVMSSIDYQGWIRRDADATPVLLGDGQLINRHVLWVTRHTWNKTQSYVYGSLVCSFICC